jgi:preprotein translocase subunit SecF
MPSTTRFNFDFLKYGRPAAMASSLAVIASLVLLVSPGPNYGIDFIGGSNIIARFDGATSISDVRASADRMDLADLSVQAFGMQEADVSFLIQSRSVGVMTEERSAELVAAVEARFPGADVDTGGGSNDRVYIRLPLSDEERASERTAAEYQERAESEGAVLEDALRQAGFDNAEVEIYGNPRDHQFRARLQSLQGVFAAHFQAEFGDRFHAIDRVETVGPRVGQQLRDDGIAAVLMALVFILLYIVLRFDVRYAPGAVMALFHDVLITLGIFVILRQEFSLPIIAAMLTIVGYSLNDTIVNFDRVRENLQLGDVREGIEQTVNRSINECLSRTLLTSVTTLIAVVVIFILGGGLIRTFALALLIGVVVGTYSSIFISNPMMIYMNGVMERRAQQQARASTAPAA